MEYASDLAWELMQTGRYGRPVTYFQVFDDRVLRGPLPAVVHERLPFCGRSEFELFMDWHDWRIRNPDACSQQSARPPASPAPPGPQPI